MSNLSSHTPNTFSAIENPSLSEAFSIAWRALTAQHIDPDDSLNPVVLQCRIASAIMSAAAEGITDSTLMAKAAVKRCSAIHKL